MLDAASIAVVLDVYYTAVDPELPGEPVGFFGPNGGTSPFWQAIAREYVERWVHHSQVLRALGRPSLAEPRFLVPGMEVISTAFHARPTVGGPWALGDVDLGPAEQAAAILTRAHTAAEIRDLVTGPPDRCELLAAVAGRG